ncbi:serine hydrolase [Pseudomonas sp. PA15(2017)]|uniref:serine hydrolase domain-containing protein n=1 Tax=Pseudomonas sp. PA15(2017) TaxID=1932111 RepID=UPI00095DF2A0|nr:serine hydrolase domain-containing protein [Pseudomonas sp. PA15(2017)]OLU27311.1 serine hydrolase [Pseudomonas sp. PA15(2017)]
MSAFSNSLVINGQLLTTAPSEQIVPWWSFGKTLLAATALTLVRDGLLRLHEVLPAGAFTLRQLLRHEAGLADYGELADYHAAVARGDEPWSADEMLERLEATRLRYQPGVGWGYSNVGYLYIRQLIEAVTGEPLENAIEQRVIQPLGVSGVRLARAPADLHDVDMGSAAVYHPGWVYHGLLVGRVSDAALLLDRLLGTGLLPEPLLVEMQTRRVLGGPLAGRPWVVAGYALGLMQGDVAGGLTLSGHTGCGPGSVIAAYRCTSDAGTATCAVFGKDAGEGDVEAEMVTSISHALASVRHAIK